MSDPRDNLFHEFMDERLPQYERFFSSSLWKKSLLPFLRAHREIAVNGWMANHDHIAGDIQKGRALALDAIINLPKYLELRRKGQTDARNEGSPVELNQPATAAFDEYSPAFDDLP